MAKLNVVRTIQDGSLIGYINPDVAQVVGMTTQVGVISSYSAGLVGFTGLGYEHLNYQYADLITVASGDAVGSVAWPSGLGCQSLEPDTHSFSQTRSGSFEYNGPHLINF